MLGDVKINTLCSETTSSIAIGPKKVDDSGYLEKLKAQHTNQKPSCGVRRGDKVITFLSGKIQPTIKSQRQEEQ